MQSSEVGFGGLVDLFRQLAVDDFRRRLEGVVFDFCQRPLHKLLRFIGRFARCALRGASDAGDGPR